MRKREHFCGLKKCKHKISKSELVTIMPDTRLSATAKSAPPACMSVTAINRVLFSHSNSSELSILDDNQVSVSRTTWAEHASKTDDSASRLLTMLLILVNKKRYITVSSGAFG